MMKTFRDKVVFITGAASGIGKRTALDFAESGAQLALCDINIEGGQQLVNELTQLGSIARFYQLDVTDVFRVRDTIQQIVKDFGRLDIGINNAGIGGKSPAKTGQHTLEDWFNIIAVNQSGVFYCMKYELQVMEQQGSGIIINISSIAGMRALPNQLAYVASKHAVVGMTKTAALEYARSNIRINAVCPVFTLTPLVDELFTYKDDIKEKLLRTIPIGRFGEVQDISNAILWLCHPDSSYVTGVCLPIDGGQTA